MPLKNRRPNGRPLIVFDIGNVLLKFDFFRAARNFDRFDPGAGDRLSRLLWTSTLNRRLETGALSGIAIYRRLRKQLKLRMSYAQFCASFNHIFTPVEENLMLLRRLAGRYEVALLSNTNGIHWRYIHRKYPALRRARWPYSSHILGHMKPDPRAYRALARRTGFALKEMVFVDDRPENVEAARELGMRALLYTEPRRLHRDFSKLGLMKGAA